MSNLNRNVSFNRSVSFNKSVSFKHRAQSLGSPRLLEQSWVSRLFRVLIVLGSVSSCLLAIGGGYLYVIPNLTKALHESSFSGFNKLDRDCDIFDGNWVLDNNYPLYSTAECPFVEQAFNCLGNGRTDKEYRRWRWKPKKCDISRFNVHKALEMLRNKRVVFVGDSMSRTQWESDIFAHDRVEDKHSVYEVHGSNITKQIRFLGVKFSSFNFTIEYYRSVFLVQHNWSSRHCPRVRSALKLNVMDDISKEWINSDVLIFNTGQWWVPGKLFGTQVLILSLVQFWHSYAVIMFPPALPFGFIVLFLPYMFDYNFSRAGLKQYLAVK